MPVQARGSKARVRPNDRALLENVILVLGSTRDLGVIDRKGLVSNVAIQEIEIRGAKLETLGLKNEAPDIDDICGAPRPYRTGSICPSQRPASNDERALGAPICGSSQKP